MRDLTATVIIVIHPLIFYPACNSTINKIVARNSVTVNNDIRKSVDFSAVFIV